MVVTSWPLSSPLHVLLAVCDKPTSNSNSREKKMILKTSVRKELVIQINTAGKDNCEKGFYPGGRKAKQWSEQQTEDESNKLRWAFYLGSLSMCRPHYNSSIFCLAFIFLTIHWKRVSTTPAFCNIHLCIHHTSSCPCLWFKKQNKSSRKPTEPKSDMKISKAPNT